MRLPETESRNAAPGATGTRYRSHPVFRHRRQIYRYRGGTQRRCQRRSRFDRLRTGGARKVQDEGTSAGFHSRRSDGSSGRHHQWSAGLSDFCSIVERFKGKRVVVFGDLVADVFVYGEISRISREAPVLILNHRETQVVPGGGANAIHNLWALGAHPIPIGLVGDDAEGRQLLQYFSSLGIDITGIAVAKAYRTPSKMRILAGAVHSQRQQIVRLDAGSPLRDDKLRTAMERKLKITLRDADA